MAENNFTIEQKQAIFTDNKNLLISAAAGSGKTYVLIKRCLELIVTKRVPVQRLLVVTFTKAAANEMKSRLIEYLDQIENKDDYIKEQLTEVLSSNISTVHSFCAKLLKTYFYEIGLDPSFVLLDEIETASLKEKSCAKLIDFAYEKKDNSFFELMDMFSQNRKDENFKLIILKLYSFLQTQVDADLWFSSSISNAYNLNFSNNNVVEYFCKFVDLETKSLIEELNSVKIDAESAKNDNLSSVINAIISNLSLFNNGPSLKDKLNAVYTQVKLPILRSSNNTENEFLIERVKELRERYKLLIKNISTMAVENSVDDIKKRLEICKSRIVSLFNYVKIFEKYFNEIKLEKVALDFNDLEHYAIKLLKNENVRKSVRDSYDYVFVDEYQDTNYVQEEILNLVSRENNRYMVGDVKQSIYKFRESEPQIFIDKYNRFKKLEDDKNLAINLQKNFRSHRNILAFTNQIFSNVMTNDFGGVDYKNDAMLIKGGQEFPLSDDSDFPVVKIDEIIKPKVIKEEVCGLEPYSVMNHNFDNFAESISGTAEGKVVVAEIEKLRGKLIYISKNNSYRVVTLSDIAILTSSRGEYLKYILKELENAGISYSSDVSSDIFDDKYMKVIKSFLEILDNPKQDIPLLILMQSEIFNFNTSELALMRMEFRDQQYFYKCVEKVLSDSGFDIRIKNKVIYMQNLLNKYRQRSIYTEVDNLIIEFMKESSFESFMLSSEEGEKSSQKLNKFLSFINGKKYNNSLSKFIDSLTENAITFENICTSNSVRVTTIHKSKGLEFPIVFLVGAGKDLLYDKSDALVASNKLGLGINYYDTILRTKSSTIVKNVCNEESKKYALEEKSRLLYVALTRAVNHLVVVGVKKEGNSGAGLKKPQNAKCFFDWIDYAIQDKFDGKLEKDADFKIERFKFDDLQVKSERAIPKNIEFGEVDDRNSLLKSEIEKSFNFKYQFKEFENKEAKTSVSEVLKSDEQDSYFTNFFSGNTDALEKGLAYHKIMEKIEFRKHSIFEIEKLISKLTLDEELTQKQAELIDSTVIMNTINSEEFLSMVSNKKVLREQEFIALENSNLSDSDKTLIQGVVDLVVFDENNNITIVDYKTNSWKDEKRFIDKYKPQLDLYAYAIEQAFNAKVNQKAIWSFGLARFINV